MAVEYDGGVVIGADSRTTTGYDSCILYSAPSRLEYRLPHDIYYVSRYVNAIHHTYMYMYCTLFYNTTINVSFACFDFSAYIANRVTDKLTKITDKIYCCRSGSAADTQAVADIVSYHLNFQK